jgi:hypothetical protein
MGCASSLEPAMLNVVKKRIDPERGNVGIAFEIGVGGKIGARVAVFTPTGFQIMPNGIDVTVTDIGICTKIPGAIEQVRFR